MCGILISISILANSPENLFTSFLLITACFAVLPCGRGDPQNLILNGDFESQAFTFGVFSQQDVIHGGEMGYIPFFNVVYGGVQVLDGKVYAPPAETGGKFLIHLNYHYGAGVLVSVPLVTPRRGATYYLTFDAADNPDGGPLYKYFRVRILVNNQFADPDIQPFTVSSPGTTRRTISWARLGVFFVGTGQSTTVQFESLVPGAYGILLDNINVTIISLIDNGSFEATSTNLYLTNGAYYNMLSAPSTAIQSWTVSTGSIKRASNSRWQSSTDRSLWMLDLNANRTPGMITSDPFPTRKGYGHALLYDATANPEDSPDVSGVLFVAILSSPSNKMLATQFTTVDASAYSMTSLGWQTYVLVFKAAEDSACVQFMSKIPGSEGPLLDNVVIHQLVPIGKYKGVKPTFGMASTIPTPPKCVTILAGMVFLFLNLV